MAQDGNTHPLAAIPPLPSNFRSLPVTISQSVWRAYRVWDRGQGSQGLRSSGHLGGLTVNEVKTGSDQWLCVSNWVLHVYILLCIYYIMHILNFGILVLFIFVGGCGGGEDVFQFLYCFRINYSIFMALDPKIRQGAMHGLFLNSTGAIRPFENRQGNFKNSDMGYYHFLKSTGNIGGPQSRAPYF